MCLILVRGKVHSVLEQSPFFISAHFEVVGYQIYFSPSHALFPSSFGSAMNDVRCSQHVHIPGFTALSVSSESYASSRSSSSGGTPISVPIAISVGGRTFMAIAIPI